MLNHQLVQSYQMMSLLKTIVMTGKYMGLKWVHLVETDHKKQE
jgi:hypothetical protein